MRTVVLAGVGIGLAAGLAACMRAQAEPVPTLKEGMKDKFLIGTAVPVRQVNGRERKADSVTTLHFNHVVPENCMKSAEVNPKEGVYRWKDSDALVRYGEERGMAVTGHALVWHSQLAPWFLKDRKGNDVTPEVLKERMRNHIHTMVGRYKGRIKGWDVVNEAIMENGTYRNSGFYRILGDEYIPFAFECAHEADPEAELYLNDYSMWEPRKCDKYVEIIRELKRRGIRIDAMGMQGHVGMDYPELAEFETSIEKLAGAGVNVMITEFDMSALPTLHRSADVGSMRRMSKSERDSVMRSMNPYRNGLPEEVSAAWNARMGEWLGLFDKHSDVITRVTLWGAHDGLSWKNGFPIPGRTDYPLAFGRDGRMKAAFEAYAK